MSEANEVDGVVMFFNGRLLTKQALEKIESVGIKVKEVYGKAWLLAVTLNNGQTVAAYPISRINPLAPPDICMTDEECNEGEDNRKAPSKIARKLRKWCKEDDLIDAIKLLKKAIISLET